MSGPLNKANDRKLKASARYSLQAKSAPVLSRARQKDSDRTESRETRAAQADFLDALEESVRQANEGRLTPIEPFLEELWVKYGDGQNPGN